MAEVDGENSLTVLEFYEHILRTLGIPARFYFDGEEWVADGPFTPVTSEKVDALMAEACA